MTDEHPIKPLSYPDAARLGARCAEWGWTLEALERQCAAWRDALIERGVDEEIARANARWILDGYRDYRIRRGR